MLSKDNDKKEVEQQDLKYLDNLKEDLQILETSWRNQNLKPKRLVRHFQEIMDSLSEIARVEAIESAGVVCASLKEYLASVAAGNTNLRERAWATTADLIDLLADSLREGNVPHAGLENLKTRWKEETNGEELPDKDVSTEAVHAEESPLVVPNGAQAHNLEENEMSPNNGSDAKELLQKAQEALLSGQGEDAKALALKAAELIAQGEVEERKQKELSLRTDLENIISEESEAEQSGIHIKEKIAESEETLNELTERLSKAQSTLDEREAACRKIRDDIEQAEAQMAAMKEKHKELLDQFQEVLPARDAAERECTKIKAEYGELPLEIESLRDRMQDMDHRLEQIRKRKTDAEAELEKFAEITTV
jgi:uncharacterized phage infection (PIP) family protein YhgE